MVKKKFINEKKKSATFSYSIDPIPITKMHQVMIESLLYRVDNNPYSVDGIYLQRKRSFSLSSLSATIKKTIKFLESRVHRNIPRIQDPLLFFFFLKCEKI